MKPRLLPNGKFEPMPPPATGLQNPVTWRDMSTAAHENASSSEYHPASSYHQPSSSYHHPTSSYLHQHPTSSYLHHHQPSLSMSLSQSHPLSPPPRDQQHTHPATQSPPPPPQSVSFPPFDWAQLDTTPTDHAASDKHLTDTRRHHAVMARLRRIERACISSTKSPPPPPPPPVTTECACAGTVPVFDMAPLLKLARQMDELGARVDALAEDVRASGERRGDGHSSPCKCGDEVRRMQRLLGDRIGTLRKDINTGHDRTSAALAVLRTGTCDVLSRLHARDRDHDEEKEKERDEEKEKEMNVEAAVMRALARAAPLLARITTCQHAACVKPVPISLPLVPHAQRTGRDADTDGRNISTSRSGSGSRTPVVWSQRSDCDDDIGSSPLREHSRSLSTSPSVMSPAPRRSNSSRYEDPPRPCLVRPRQPHSLSLSLSTSPSPSVVSPAPRHQRPIAHHHNAPATMGTNCANGWSARTDGITMAVPLRLSLSDSSSPPHISPPRAGSGSGSGYATRSRVDNGMLSVRTRMRTRRETGDGEGKAKEEEKEKDGGDDLMKDNVFKSSGEGTSSPRDAPKEPRPATRRVKKRRRK